MRYRRAGLAAIVAASILIGTTGSSGPVIASSQGPAVAALQRQVDRQQHRIRALQHRRAYLHRYIKKLRTSRRATSLTSSHTGSTYITEAQAADAMAAAGFSSTVIAWFNNGIIQRESGYCTTAVYGYGCTTVAHFYAGGPACSLFQLYHCPGPQVADPYVAARYAYAKFQEQGYSAWS